MFMVNTSTNTQANQNKNINSNSSSSANYKLFQINTFYCNLVFKFKFADTA